MVASLYHKRALTVLLYILLPLLPRPSSVLSVHSNAGDTQRQAMFSVLAVLLAAVPTAQHAAVDRWGLDAVRIRIYPKQQPSTPDPGRGYLLPPVPTTAATPASNIAVTVAQGTGYVTVTRLSDSTVLFQQRMPVATGTVRPDGTMAINATFAVMPAGSSSLRFFGGGCRCGGGFTPADNDEGGAMINTGDASHGRSDLHFGVPIGLAKGQSERISERALGMAGHLWHLHVLAVFC